MEFWIDYELPSELVAQQPLEHRPDARLMVIRREDGSIDHHHVRDLPRILAVRDRLILNDTKVIAAQLRGVRVATGGRWQGLYLGTSAAGDWQLVCKTRGRLSPPEQIVLTDRHGKSGVKLWLLQQQDEGIWLARPEDDRPALEVLDEVGHMPLPPYIRKGHSVDSDFVDYQTVYARTPGAVAAPTAGLHFTKELLKALKQSGIDLTAVTLHVGMGTFRPIVVDDISQHPMHAEAGELSAGAASDISATRTSGGRNIAVGTTVARVLEAAAVEQGLGHRAEALRAWQGTTRLFIRPPYEFQVVDGLLTNFHFPRTTLLLLVQAFAGTELIRRAYEIAVKEEYRFYSYGDAMLIL